MKRVTKYEANDGSIHDTAVAARKRDALCYFKNSIDSPGNQVTLGGHAVPIASLAHWVEENKEPIKVYIAALDHAEIQNVE